MILYDALSESITLPHHADLARRSRSLDLHEALAALPGPRELQGFQGTSRELSQGGPGSSQGAPGAPKELQGFQGSSQEFPEAARGLPGLTRPCTALQGLHKS